MLLPPTKAVKHLLIPALPVCRRSHVASQWAPWTAAQQPQERQPGRGVEQVLELQQGWCNPTGCSCRSPSRRWSGWSPSPSPGATCPSHPGHRGQCPPADAQVGTLFGVCGTTAWGCPCRGHWAGITAQVGTLWLLRHHSLGLSRQGTPGIPALCLLRLVLALMATCTQPKAPRCSETVCSSGISYTALCRSEQHSSSPSHPTPSPS